MPHQVNGAGIAELAAVVLFLVGRHAHALAMLPCLTVVAAHHVTVLGVVAADAADDFLQRGRGEHR